MKNLFRRRLDRQHHLVLALDMHRRHRRLHNKLDLNRLQLCMLYRYRRHQHLDQLPSAITPGIRENRHCVGFFGKMSPFSNFHPARFTISDTEYSCTEQYYQAQKALILGDKKAQRTIMASTNPVDMFKVGRSLDGDDNDNWTSSREDIMFKGNMAKYTQNQELLELLIATGEKTLVECSARETYWGSGVSLHHADALNQEWPGENRMGVVLERVRAEIIHADKLDDDDP